jgi:hypothetical protein
MRPKENHVTPNDTAANVTTVFRTLFTKLWRRRNQLALLFDCLDPIRRCDWFVSRNVIEDVRQILPGGWRDDESCHLLGGLH